MRRCDWIKSECHEPATKSVQLRYFVTPGMDEHGNIPTVVEHIPQWGTRWYYDEHYAAYQRMAYRIPGLQVKF